MLAWDARSVLVALNALTPFLFLPAWPVAVVAAIAIRTGEGRESDHRPIVADIVRTAGAG